MTCPFLPDMGVPNWIATHQVPLKDDQGSWKQKYGLQAMVQSHHMIVQRDGSYGSAVTQCQTLCSTVNPLATQELRGDALRMQDGCPGHGGDKIGHSRLTSGLGSWSMKRMETHLSFSPGLGQLQRRATACHSW